MVVLDIGFFCIDGYFEEICLCGVYVGQKVDICLMGEVQLLQGYVQSIVVGIEDCYCSEGSSLLLNVILVFDWVCLVQCILVCIYIDCVLVGVNLIVGCIVMVIIELDVVIFILV